MPDLHSAHPLIQLIDQAQVEDALKEPPFRPHLGGSLIGRACERELWYSFRWAIKVPHNGRMLRLFNRGHREEERFIGFLRRIGCEVREYSERLVWDRQLAALDPERVAYSKLPWDQDISADCGLVDVTDDPWHRNMAKSQGIKLKQWRVAAFGDHFSGSLDGIASKVPTFDPDEELLVEFKTHNTKSFMELVRIHNEAKPGESPVKKAKPTHWAQMQIYMHLRGLKRALYLAVNKNDDDLYIEVVEYDPTAAEELLPKAKRVILAKQPPNRIGNHPAWFDCKFCDYKKVCHYAYPMERHCRSCVHSSPVDEGQWHCGLWNAIIPVDAILKGCDNYKMITD